MVNVSDQDMQWIRDLQLKCWIVFLLSSWVTGPSSSMMASMFVSTCMEPLHISVSCSACDLEDRFKIQDLI